MSGTGLRLPPASLLAMLTLAAGVAAIRPVQAAPGAPAIHDFAAAYTESGEASWYGPRHEGMRTTSGERFDSLKLTAAHSSLPMGAYVRVTLAENGRSIVVRVNDREPAHGVRCIDLSRAAASKLGFVGRGVADVTLAQITPEEAHLGDSLELAEAPDDATAMDTGSARHATGRHGRRHTHRALR